ncbi:MAG TPA: hypothetical protein VK188_19170 [Holophaga sp.]|nr:hypothetical protein [Holophaga sp.]
MGRGWRLGGRWFSAVEELAGAGEIDGCSWWVVRQDGHGPRHLLQIWEPLPAPRVLDAIREDFLRRYDQGEPLDPGPCRMGHDRKGAWFLQKLDGVPLVRLWEEEDAPGREALAATVGKALAGSRAPRLAVAAAIRVRPGRILVPRTLGPAPWPGDWAASLPQGPPGPGRQRIWEEAQGLADPAGVPIRGRTRELTYLKSLMLALGSPSAQERVVLLLGEEGLGQDALCDWAAAAAQTEGRWAVDLELQPGERAGAFLERILEEALAGMEADLYAAEPALAKALSRRMASFAFLRGGRGAVPPGRRLEVEEVEAALEALAWADARHPRLCVLRGLEAMTTEVLDLVRGLTARGRLPWILSFRGQGSCQGLRPWLESARSGPNSAAVVLERLEEAALAETLSDLLGPAELPPGFREAACAGALGNPGLLRRILDMAVLRGDLVREGGRWTCASGSAAPPAPEEAEAQAILSARIARLAPPALRALRALALGEGPLAPAVLARFLGLDADSAEAHCQALLDAQLALEAEGRLRVHDGRVRELVEADLEEEEARSVAGGLIRAMEAEGGRPVLAVRLRTCARDAATAVAQVLEAMERERPGPREAREAVDEALALDPGPEARARLWECLADAWDPDRAPEEAGGANPAARSLEALLEAIRALGDPSPGSHEEEAAARLHRKAAFQEIRLRRLQEAHLSIRRSAAYLADHPFHPEQARLRLALGRLHLVQGSAPKAARALEEGLMLLARREGGEGHADRAALQLELGRVQGQRAQFEASMDNLQAARRLLEHAGDRQGLAGALEAIGQLHLGMGQTDAACHHLGEALALARAVDDPALKASCHLDLGVARSMQQHLGPAMAHLDSALRRSQALGDLPQASRALAWKARTVAMLGDPVQADFLLAKAAEVREDQVSPMERGDAAFIAGELEALRHDWGQAQRRFQEAVNLFLEAGLHWRERLARLRHIQAEASADGDVEAAWVRLERLKGPVEASGSRWLELEWRRAHALLLQRSGPGDAVATEALLAWGEVLSLARELRFPHLAMEAAAREADLLLARGERLGARSRIQDAVSSFMEIWSRVPAHMERAFSGRPDVRAFEAEVAAAGVPFNLPAKTDPLADWSPTQANLLLPSTNRGTP